VGRKTLAQYQFKTTQHNGAEFLTMDVNEQGVSFFVCVKLR